MPGNSNRERGGDTCVLSPSPLKTGTESCTCTSRGREKGGRKGVVYKRRAPDSTPAQCLSRQSSLGGKKGSPLK